MIPVLVLTHGELATELLSAAREIDSHGIAVNVIQCRGRWYIGAPFSQGHHQFDLVVKICRSRRPRNDR